jgi:hypothetical protein
MKGKNKGTYGRAYNPVLSINIGHITLDQLSGSCGEVSQPLHLRKLFISIQIALFQRAQTFLYWYITKDINWGTNRIPLHYRSRIMQALSSKMILLTPLYLRRSNELSAQLTMQRQCSALMDEATEFQGFTCLINQYKLCMD